MFVPDLDPPVFSVATTTADGLSLHGQTYSDTSSLNNTQQLQGTDVVVATVGRSQFTLGSGAYVAPKE